MKKCIPEGEIESVRPSIYDGVIQNFSDGLVAGDTTKTLICWKVKVKICKMASSTMEISETNLRKDQRLVRVRLTASPSL